MSNHLVFSIHFLQPRSHGRGDNGDPEWPPSPMRLMQALVAAAAGHWNERQQLRFAAPALEWLERLPPPTIVAPNGIPATVRAQFYVPDNTTELLVPAWKKGEVDKLPKRTEKVVRPVYLLGEDLHYLFPLPDGHCEYFEVLRTAARSITHLGWGIDMAVGDATIKSAAEVTTLQGIRWSPSPVGEVSLRVPRQGSLSDLMRRHTDFLGRVSPDGFRPVPPLRAFDIVQYRSQNSLLQRPYRFFELRNPDGTRFRYSHRRLVHIAGMVRHLAIEAMRTAGPPRGVGDDWIETYVAGHKSDGATEHRQLSYIPLPSVGHPYADPGIRRVMIVAPVGDEALLDHVARRLNGQQLKPVKGNEINGEPPLLVPLPRTGDGVTKRFTDAAHTWYSFTPVILPGHDDHKPDKTRKLIIKALLQSGIDQPCEFEWSPFSRFPKSFGAHKYVHDEDSGEGKRRIGYIRPDHLLDQTAVHLVLRFGRREEPDNPESPWIPHSVPGPITIGAGRHCGFGLMAAIAGD
jgi:CRISPR-associated protein Csb2